MEEAPVRHKILGIDPGTNVMGYALLNTHLSQSEVEVISVIQMKKMPDHYAKLKFIYEKVNALIEEYKPDILVITGHDAFNKKSGNIHDINNYKNSSNFVKAVKAARKFERSHDKLVIISGACQSNYEELIKAGSNFASSPKRINIHALDPAIIATCVAITEKNKNIDLIDLLNKTKYGPDGMGGIICNGLMYVGFPRT